ncbi:MAG: DUF502 domain-containing protein [Planctomycetota bacterium]|jgi:uncharacterized membrane protein
MTTNPAARTFSSDFKRFFLRGLVVLLPSVLTLWIVVKAYQFVDNAIAEPINGWVRVGLIQAATAWEPLREEFDPSETAIQAEARTREAAGVAPLSRARIRADLRAANIRQWWDNHWYLDLIGLVVAIIAVYVAGRLLGGFFGRHIYRRLENFFTALPVVKQVYPYVKQVVDFLFSDERAIKFNRVVVMEYPRKGIWSVGFLTGPTMRSIARESGDSVTVFIPSSPTPFTGYTITVPRSDVVDQAFDEAGGAAPPRGQEQAPALPQGGPQAPQTAGPGRTESRHGTG